MSSSLLLGVNITSPQKGQQIPINSNDLTISGKSTDKPADDCRVSVIVDGLTPYQSATANGMTGQNNDYSRWFFILNPNYSSIKEGENKITAKLSCLPTIAGDYNNMTRWHSINVTGTTNDNTTISPQSPPVINSNAEVKPNNRDEQATPLEPKTNKEQEAPMFDSNNNGKKIRYFLFSLS